MSISMFFSRKALTTCHPDLFSKFWRLEVAACDIPVLGSGDMVATCDIPVLASGDMVATFDIPVLASGVMVTACDTFLAAP